MQTKFWSIIEVISSTIFGLIVSFIAMEILYHKYNLPVPSWVNFEITVWMTILSVVRSYIFRRVFNKISKKV